MHHAGRARAWAHPPHCSSRCDEECAARGGSIHVDERGVTLEEATGGPLCCGSLPRHVAANGSRDALSFFRVRDKMLGTGGELAVARWGFRVD